jgi:hypothetical protein
MDGIDIIDFTNVQYSLLTKGQLQTIRTAQQKKDRLYRALQKALRKAKHRLVKNGVFRSGIYTMLEERLTEEYEEEVDVIRQGLLFYLRYSMKPTQSAPYEVNYSLTDEERFNIVKRYYEGTYSDPDALLEAFNADKIAPQ